jgi:hypothetical protein
MFMSNENAVTNLNIADLWVASAMDNENHFEVNSDIEDGDANSLELSVPLTRDFK